MAEMCKSILSVYPSLYWIKWTPLFYFRALLGIADVLGSCYLHASLQGSNFDDNGKDVGLITNLCFWIKPLFSPPLLLAVETMVVPLVTHMIVKL